MNQRSLLYARNAVSSQCVLMIINNCKHVLKFPKLIKNHLTIAYSSIGLSKILNITPVFVYFKYRNGYSSIEVLNLIVFSQTVSYSSICLHTRVYELSLKTQVTMVCLWKLHTRVSVWILKYRLKCTVPYSSIQTHTRV